MLWLIIFIDAIGRMNNFIMDYNQFTYYRANPYANQGYMPPTAFINRHRPNFLTELPMGQQHLNKIGKKQYSNNAHRSQIETENILKSPERYPYENRIAFDKQYERNLNTIDIEGASGGTLVSQAVRNKMKAREELIRRQESENLGNRLQPIKNGETFEEEKRRKVAYTQFLKDQQIKQMNQTKRLNQISMNDCLNQNSPSKQIENMEEGAGNKYYMNLRNRKNEIDHSPLIKARYQSIDLARLRDSQPQQPQNNHIFGNLGYEHQKRKQSMENGYEVSSRYGSKESQSSRTPVERPKEIPYEHLAKDRKSLRYQNPTNLSSEGSIHYAARSIIKGE